MLNRTPLPLQMSTQQRIELLDAIAALEFPPYGKQAYAVDALSRSERLARGEDVWPPPTLESSATPSRRRATNTSQSRTGHTTERSTGRVGRPPNTTTDIEVFIYTEVRVSTAHSHSHLTTS